MNRSGLIQDAAERGIKTGDIVKAFNERGVVLCGAGDGKDHARAVYVDHGAGPIYYPGKGGPGRAIN
jgi:anaerobic selenocysteine-containing dehydrogenase